MRKLLPILILIFCGGFLSAQDAGADAQPALTFDNAGGCNAELNGYRPKIYVANFLVTYGKKDMGRLIADYIAQRFEADGRFEVISREEIEDSMRPLFKKKLEAGVYLQTTVELAAARNADCVIFGRITKAGSKRVSFLVRMASVKTGENVRNVDTEVERKQAIKFLEGVGDSFVSFFQAAPPPVIAAPVEKSKERHAGLHLGAMVGGGYYDISASSGGLTVGLGGPAAQFGARIGVALNSSLVLFGGANLFNVVNPTVRAATSSASGSASTNNTELSGNLLGAGLTIYSPSHFYVSGMVGAAQATLSFTSGTTKISGSTETGFGASIALGQEWSVSKDWGIGVGLMGSYSQLPDHGVTWTQYYLGLAVTASYN